jgi:predicted cytidylate kinase
MNKMSTIIRAIAISGEAGTGKSTISSCLIDLLPNWNYINTGQRFRDFCDSKGMSIQQVSHIPDEVHREFDRLQTELLQTESNVIIEGRLAGWLAREIKDVFKVYCHAPLEIRAKRYMSRHSVNYEHAVADIDYRDSNDRLKFEKIYSVEDYREHRFYNLILDTSTLSPLELAKSILLKANLLIASHEA